MNKNKIIKYSTIAVTSLGIIVSVIYYRNSIKKSVQNYLVQKYIPFNLIEKPADALGAPKVAAIKNSNLGDENWDSWYREVSDEKGRLKKDISNNHKITVQDNDAINELNKKVTKTRYIHDLTLNSIGIDSKGKYAIYNVYFVDDSKNYLVANVKVYQQHMRILRWSRTDRYEYQLLHSPGALNHLSVNNYLNALTNTLLNMELYDDLKNESKAMPLVNNIRLNATKLDKNSTKPLLNFYKYSNNNFENLYVVDMRVTDVPYQVNFEIVLSTKDGLKKYVLTYDRFKKQFIKLRIKEA